MKVYAVTMYRYGDREKHSYVLGVFSSQELAKECGQREKIFRGNKYSPDILPFLIDAPLMDCPEIEGDK